MSHIQRIVDEIATDNAAHCLYQKIITRRNYGSYCPCCGTPLQTAYHEERLYSVRCEVCDIVSLVTAPSASAAELEIIRFATGSREV